MLSNEDITRRSFLGVCGAVVIAPILPEFKHSNGLCRRQSSYFCCIASADVPNKNNHVYSKEVLQKICEDFKKRTMPLPGSASNNVMCGQIGMTTDAPIPLQNISHIVLDLWFNYNKLWAVIKILNTPQGRILRKILCEERIVFRTYGTCDDNQTFYNKNREVIIKNYKLINIHAVRASEAA